VGPERLMLWCARRNGPVIPPAVPPFWSGTSTNFCFCRKLLYRIWDFCFFPAHASHETTAHRAQANMAPAGERQIRVSSSDWPRRHCSALYRSRPPLCCLWGGPCMARRSCASGGLPVLAQRQRTCRPHVQGRPSYWPWRSGSALYRSRPPLCCLCAPCRRRSSSPAPLLLAAAPLRCCSSSPPLFVAAPLCRLCLCLLAPYMRLAHLCARAPPVR
jgi:hypothetical protein